MGAISDQIQSSGHLSTQAHEFVKQYIVYDGSGRTEFVYTARADALNNSPCTVVQYAFFGLTANVQYMKESKATWLTAWEVF